jgi:hypothetical protein
MFGAKKTFSGPVVMGDESIMVCHLLAELHFAVASWVCSVL